MRRRHADRAKTIVGTFSRNRRPESVFAKQPKNLPLRAEIGVKPKISENNFIAKIRDSESAKHVLRGS
jgi:hypothetical protein